MEGELFVGRQQELDALLAAVKRTAGQVLLLCGDPGAGKSALLAEFHRRLNGASGPARRFSLLYRPAETDTVNATLVELMEALLHVEDLTRGRLVWGVPSERDRWRQLLKVVPSVGTLLAQLVGNDRRPPRARFLDTLAAVAGYLQPEERLVLCFDPQKYLHRDAAAEWLLIADALPAQVSVLFAQRQDDVLIASADFVALPTVHRAPPRPLGFLSREDSDRFLHEWIRQTPALADLGRAPRAAGLDELLAEFWSRYTGYALAMRIVADELCMTPGAPLTTLRGLPRRLRDLFEGQYNRVRDKGGPIGLRLLKALALQPGPTPPAILGGLLALDRESLEQLVARREIRELLRTEPGPRFAFYHGLFQEFVSEPLDTTERRDWHRKSLDAYLPTHNVAPGGRSALLATEYHWEKSNLDVDEPRKHAITAHTLGAAFAKLPDANQGENLKKAIACYGAALRIYTEQDFPAEWARTQTNLGVAYRELPSGDRGANLARAIACLEAALRILTEQDYPAEWADAEIKLGITYREVSSGDREANLAQAIACFEAALRIYTEQDFPAEWARTQNCLGAAYWSSPSGDREANLAQAIACFEAALRIYTEEHFPQDWAGAQSNLGAAYYSLPSGDRGVTVARAIACYEAALRVYTEQKFPVEWARVQTSLGIANSALPSGDRGVNVARAIACYEAALRVYSERNFPARWANTQTCLGAAYWSSPSGDPAANRKQAISYYEAAVRGYETAGLSRDAEPIKRFLASSK